MHCFTHTSPKASAAAGGHRGAPGTAAGRETRRGAAAAGAAGGAHAAHGHQLARRPAMGWGKSGGEWWENGDFFNQFGWGCNGDMCVIENKASLMSYLSRPSFPHRSTFLCFWIPIQTQSDSINSTCVFVFYFILFLFSSVLPFILLIFYSAYLLFCLSLILLIFYSVDLFCLSWILFTFYSVYPSNYISYIYIYIYIFMYIEQSAIPQLRSHASRTKTTRFQNQTTRFPNQSRRASTTTFSRFHNQNVTIPQQNLFIPQPNSQDSTTKTSGFHNQTLTIPQLTSQDSTTKSRDSTTNNYWFHQEDCRYLLSL